MKEITSTGERDTRDETKLDHADRAETRKWLRHCPAASNVGASACSFKMIGIIAGKKNTCA